MKLGKDKIDWPRGPFSWFIGKTLYTSIPFTWNLPDVRDVICQTAYFKKVIVGGPALKLMPDYFSDMSHVEVRQSYPGVLQMINPLATRTTEGCINACGFCAVKTIEGKFRELPDWPDRPILCDNNLLAASGPHFDKVMDRLERHGWADFNQGLDARLLTDYHACRIAKISKAAATRIRLALDNMGMADKWLEAVNRLRSAKVPKKRIRSYILIGFNTGPDEAWERCRFVEKHIDMALPMWFHELDAMKHNTVTEKQTAHGWNDYERRRIMLWFYQHKRAKQKSIVIDCSNPFKMVPV